MLTVGALLGAREPPPCRACWDTTRPTTSGCAALPRLAPSPALPPRRARAHPCRPHCHSRPCAARWHPGSAGTAVGAFALR